jgi:hypothetical protein
VHTEPNATGTRFERDAMEIREEEHRCSVSKGKRRSERRGTRDWGFGTSSRVCDHEVPMVLRPRVGRERKQGAKSARIPSVVGGRSVTGGGRRPAPALWRCCTRSSPSPVRRSTAGELPSPSVRKRMATRGSLNASCSRRPRRQIARGALRRTPTLLSLSASPKARPALPLGRPLASETANASALCGRRRVHVAPTFAAIGQHPCDQAAYIRDARTMFLTIETNALFA